MDRGQEIDIANPYGNSSEIAYGKRIVFFAGAEWADAHPKNPWISVKDKLPEEGRRVLVHLLYHYRFADREPEVCSYVDIFTYKGCIWTSDSNVSYIGKEVSESDIKVTHWMPIVEP